MFHDFDNVCAILNTISYNKKNIITQLNFTAGLGREQGGIR